jgi:hypothetical protein
LRKVFFWSTASVVTVALLGARLRQHLPGSAGVAPPSQTVAATR